MKDRAKAGFVLAAMVWLWAAPLLGGYACECCCCSCDPAETARPSCGTAPCCEMSPGADLPAAPPAVAPGPDTVPSLHADAQESASVETTPAASRAGVPEAGDIAPSPPAFLLHASLLR